MSLFPCLPSLMGWLSWITHFLTNLIIAYCTCWTLPSLSSRALAAARGPILPFYDSPRALFWLPINGSLESARDLPSNIPESTRKPTITSVARARPWVSRRPLGARGRALGKNLKARVLSMLLSWLVSAAKVTETVECIKVMIDNTSSIPSLRAHYLTNNT